MAAASRPAARPCYRSTTAMGDGQAVEIRPRTFLIRMRRGDGGVQPDPDDAVQHLVRDPDAGDAPVADLDLRPGPAPGRVHRGGHPGRGPLAPGGDLIQCTPAGSHRRDRAEQLPAVMDQHPRRGQRLRQPRRQPGPVRQMPQQRDPGVRHDALTPPVTCRPFDHPLAFTSGVLLNLAPARTLDTHTVPGQEHFLTRRAGHPYTRLKSQGYGAAHFALNRAAFVLPAVHRAT